MNRWAIKWLGLGLMSAILAANTFFVVDQGEQAIILQFGRFKVAYTEPGLKFKIPFIQQLLYYNKRVLGYDVEPVSLTTADQKRLVVDIYTRYRISDPLLFYKTIAPANEHGASMRLDTIVGSSVRNVLGTVALEKLLSTDRGPIMQKITQEVSKKVKALGLTIVDVRIIRAELPMNNRDVVFSRMNAQLISYAKQNRAVGEQEAQKIRAQAEKQSTILVAQANKKSNMILSKANKEAAKIAMKAFEKDLNFYEIYRYLDLNNDIVGTGVEIVMSTDGILSQSLRKMVDFKEKTKNKE